MLRSWREALYIGVMQVRCPACQKQIEVKTTPCERTTCACGATLHVSVLLQVFRNDTETHLSQEGVEACPEPDHA